MPLNDSERLVINCKLMRLKENESLAYLKANGHEMSVASYYRIKGRLEGQKLKRLHQIAAEFQDMHQERIDELELIRQELWVNYHRENKPFLRAKILDMIKDLQPYISAYHEATKELIENRAREEASSISDITIEKED